MKTIIYFTFILISSLCQAQGIDVLIIGTVHHFKDEFKELQRFDKIQKDIIAYSPDIICIEAIPTDDTLSLLEISPRNIQRADSLKVELAAGKYDSHASKDQLIGASYFSNYDFWNAYYWWDSSATPDRNPGPFSEYHRKLKNSEYGNIVFPAAGKLGIEQFHHIDYRYGETQFLEENNKVMKKLLLNLKFKPIGSYLKIQKKYKRSQEEGVLMEFVNGNEFQNSFASLIDELPGILKRSEEAKSVKESWHQRNQIMANRIFKAAIAHKASKVLVTVGAAHVHHIKYYLESQGCNVTTYGELLDQPSNSN